MQWFYSEALQNERIVTKIERDFGQEIGSDMWLFLPTSDARIPIIKGKLGFPCKKFNLRLPVLTIFGGAAIQALCTYVRV